MELLLAHHAVFPAMRPEKHDLVPLGVGPRGNLGGEKTLVPLPLQYLPEHDLRSFCLLQNVGKRGRLVGGARWIRTLEYGPSPARKVVRRREGGAGCDRISGLYRER